MKPRLTQRRTLTAIDQASKLFEVPARDLVGKCRLPSIIRARFALIASLYEACETSYPEIGRLLRRDHTSVLNGHRKAIKMAEADSDYAAAIAQIAGALR